MKNGKRNRECSGILMAFRCDRSTVQGDDFFRNRKAQPGPACV